MKSFDISGLKMAGILLASTALLAGCGKKNIDGLPPVADGTEYGDGQTDPNANGNNGDGQIVLGSQEDFLRSVGEGRDRIFFDTDKYNIDNVDQATLQSQAQWLAQYPNKNIVIEGHCDERGTRDYNLALGERRANAAKNYMVSLGIDPTRIQTVSHGKERPAAIGSNESAWAQNRRAVTITVQ